MALQIYGAIATCQFTDVGGEGKDAKYLIILFRSGWRCGSVPLQYCKCRQHESTNDRVGNTQYFAGGARVNYYLNCKKHGNNRITKGGV